MEQIITAQSQLPEEIICGESGHQTKILLLDILKLSPVAKVIKTIADIHAATQRKNENISACSQMHILVDAESTPHTAFITGSVCISDTEGNQKEMFETQQECSEQFKADLFAAASVMRYVSSLPPHERGIAFEKIKLNINPIDTKSKVSKLTSNIISSLSNLNTTSIERAVSITVLGTEAEIHIPARLPASVSHFPEQWHGKVSGVDPKKMRAQFLIGDRYEWIDIKRTHILRLAAIQSCQKEADIQVTPNIVIRNGEERIVGYSLTGITQDNLLAHATSFFLDILDLTNGWPEEMI